MKILSIALLLLFSGALELWAQGGRPDAAAIVREVRLARRRNPTSYPAN